MKNEWNKWKNHFYEMKGDVGMSLHEKERNKKMPTPRHKVTHARALHVRKRGALSACINLRERGANTKMPQKKE